MTDRPSTARADRHLRVSQSIRAELGRRRMTQEGLAELTGLSMATIGRALRGKFRPETLALIESRLGVPLGVEPQPEAVSKREVVAAGAAAAPVATPLPREPRELVASSELGSYHRETVAHLEGSYLGARCAFSSPDKVVVYPMSISWSAAVGGLEFTETNRVGRSDYSQQGRIFMPPGCAYMHLATIDKGSVRLITVSFVSDKAIDREAMRGAVLTLYNPVVSTHVPAASPFVMLKVADGQPLASLSGVFERGDPTIAQIVEELAIAETHQSVFAGNRSRIG